MVIGLEETLIVPDTFDIEYMYQLENNRISS